MASGTLQQQEATNIPGWKGQGEDVESQEPRSWGYWVGDRTQQRSSPVRGKLCLNKGGETEEPQLLSKVLPEARRRNPLAVSPLAL